MSIVSVVEGNLRPTAGRRSIPAERGIGAPAAPARAPPQHDLRLSHFGRGRTIRMASQRGSLDILRRDDARGTHPCQTLRLGHKAVTAARARSVNRRAVEKGGIFARPKRAPASSMPPFSRKVWRAGHRGTRT
jgi:hypothetical protein